MSKKDTKILQGLNDEQQQAVVHGEGPQLIVAGAGTGKTTVITRRIAHLIDSGVAPEKILALTFAEKAAEEMEERIDQLLPIGFVNVQVSTFHSFGEQILKQYGLDIGLPDFEVLNEVGQWLLVKNNLEKFDLDYYQPLGNPTRFIKALVSHFSRAKDEMIDPEKYLDYAENLEISADQAESGSKQKDKSDDEADEKSRIIEVAKAFHIYQKLLLDNNALDFGDLINYPLRLFKKRPSILDKLRKQYDYILVDEFQDTNLAQYELIKLLSAPKNNITVVGDDDQSIFKFRGASVSNILHFKEDYPDAEFVTLTKNYRNSQNILDKSYQFIRQNDPDRLETKLKISKKLNSQTKNDGKIEQILAPDYLTEAGQVIGKIIELKNSDKNLTWNDFVIMARSHSSFEPFAQKLDQMQLPYLYAANQGLYRKGIILDILSFFRLLDSYHESSALNRILRLSVFEISDATIVELNHFAKRKAISLFQALQSAAGIKSINADDLKGIQKILSMIEKHTTIAREKSVSEVYQSVVQDLQIIKQVENDYQKAKFLDSFTNKIRDFVTQSEDDSLPEFMKLIEFEKQAGFEGDIEFDPDAGPEAIKLMTVHSAKGLEFEHAFIVGMVDKRFPSIRRRDEIELPDELVSEFLPEGDEHLQEERRLFYVAMTRAKTGLYFSRAYDYGGKRTKKPSRFLIELEIAEDEKAQPTGEVEFKSENSKMHFPIPKSFSFSQISLFKHCPLEYKYKYILKMPAPGSGHQSFGLTIHQTLEYLMRSYMQQQTQDLFSQDTKASMMSFADLKKVYAEKWINDWYESEAEKKKFFKAGEQVLKNILDDAKQNQPNPKYLEKRFKIKLGDYWIKGVIDRIDSTDDGFVIIDYKTGKARNLGKVDKDQLLLYQKAVQEVFGEKVSDLQYWYVRDNLKKISFIGDEKKIAKLEDSMIETIEQIIEATKNDSFYKLTVNNSNNHECEYLEIEQE